MDFGLSALVGGGMKMLANSQEAQYAQEAAAQQQQYAIQNQQRSEAFNAQQADISRYFNAGEADKARTYSAWSQLQAEDYNANQAELNRNFQEKMSSSAYQRATADMRAAGINPMVAYMQGGASTPSGGMGSVGPSGSGQASAGPANIGVLPGARTDARPGLLSGVLSSAAEAARLKPQIENIEGDTSMKGAVTSANQALAIKTKAETGKVHAETQTELERAEGVRAQAERDRQAAKQAEATGGSISFGRSGISLNPAFYYDRMKRLLGSNEPGQGDAHSPLVAPPGSWAQRNRSSAKGLTKMIEGGE